MVHIVLTSDMATGCRHYVLLLRPDRLVHGGGHDLVDVGPQIAVGVVALVRGGQLRVDVDHYRGIAQQVLMGNGYADPRTLGIDAVLPADEYPTVSPDGRIVLDMPAAVLRRMIDETAYAAASDEVRPILTG